MSGLDKLRMSAFDKLRMSGLDKLRMSAFDKLRMSGLDAIAIDDPTRGDGQQHRAAQRLPTQR